MKTAAVATKPSLTQCNHCKRISSPNNIKIKACTRCYHVGYCSKECQRADWRMHKKTNCIPIINSAAVGEDSAAEVIEINSDTVRLETQSENGTWKDVGPINLLDKSNMMNTNKTSLSTKKVLSSSTKTILGLTPNSYTFRHSHDGIDTNLLIFFHGAGDSHVPFDSLGRQMKLPQTATLSLSASMKMNLPPSLKQQSSSSSSYSFIELPFGLGFTWFEEMDYKLTGEVLANDHPQRINSLRHAVMSLDILLSSLTDQNNESYWIPERIFLIGFSSGACLAMELCRFWKQKRRMPFGGCICIGGGIKTISLMDDDSDTSTAEKSSQESQNQQFTDVLIITGSKDTTFKPKEAQKTKSCYDANKVQIHIQEGKGHGMIGSRQEMQAVMEFLSKRLVRRMTSMEGMSSS